LSTVPRAVKALHPTAAPTWLAPILPDRDVRSIHDEGVKRGWMEIARIAVRLAILVTADALVSLGVLALAALLDRTARGGPVLDFRDLALAILMVQPFIFGSQRLYDAGEARARPGPLAVGALGTGAACVGLSLLTGAPVGAPQLAALLGLAAGLFVALFGARWAVDALVRRAYRAGLGQRKLLVVANEADALSASRIVGQDPASPMRIVGRLSVQQVAEPGTVGNICELEAALRRTGARWVLLASGLPYNELQNVVHRCFELGVTIAVVPQVLDRLGARLELRHTREGSILELNTPGLPLPQLAIKRLMDLLLAGAGMVVIAPLLLVIAVLIKLDSRGPVFFRQLRAGVGGRPFQMLKFRTMVVNADDIKHQLAHLNESGDPRLFKIRKDPRVTRMGQWLRRTSLDELPQLFNVLRGEMSLVGPRPFFLQDMEQYDLHHFERLHVLPGITGLWQVAGRSDIVDFEEVVRMDAEYIRDWTLWRDLWILLRTLPAALGRGAY
jgi:exopolysaccharide biosynthesis polyprenyl glycosylphosphotransferase